MPLDPNIPLSVKPAQIASPFDVAQKVASLRNMGQQQQLQQQQIDQNQGVISEQKRQVAGRDALSKLIQANTKRDPKTGMPKPDHQAIATGLSAAGFPDLAEAWLKTSASNASTLDALAERDRKHKGDVAAAIGDAAYDSKTHDDFTANLAQATMAGLIDPSDAEDFEKQVEQPNGWEGLKNSLQRLSPKWQEQQKELNKPRDLAPGHKLTMGDKVIAEAPEKAPDVGSFEDYVVRKYGNTPTPDQITEARKAYQQADDRPRVDVNVNGPSNVKEAVAGMKDGTIPPILPGRASKEYVELLAEAHRQGYDLAGAATDWAATQKHISTMNGAQQLRLNQAINSLPEMLDKVDALASKWKGGRFPILNSANLKLAKGGAYGSEVASVANQLDAQIADVTADLGNVYMGGNSPTDHALGLAAKSLKGEWDEKVIHDMVKLARGNVQIRKNSINSTGVAGASADNPYAKPEPAATQPKRILYDSNGVPK